MRHTILLLLMLITTAIDAQNVAIGLHSSSLVYLPFDLRGSQTLDSSRVMIKYNAAYPRNDVKKGKSVAEDVMILMVGKRISKFYSYGLDCMDRRKSYGVKIDVDRRQDYVPYQIYTNILNEHMDVVNRSPFYDMDKAYSYKDSTAINWNITAVTDSVMGYLCQKATCSAYGRDWEVWFTSDIPIRLGPWRLNGLPGLILKARSGNYSFVAKELRSIKEPIYKPNWQYQSISRDAWLKLEKSWHDSPYFYFTEGGKYRIFNVFTRTDYSEDWKIPYDPIETE